MTAQTAIPTTEVTISLTDEQWRLVNQLWSPLADSLARGVFLPPMMALKGQIAAKIHEQGEDM